MSRQRVHDSRALDGTSPSLPLATLGSSRAGDLESQPSSLLNQSDNSQSQAIDAGSGDQEDELGGASATSRPSLTVGSAAPDEQ
eukprot:3017449-Pyramimonas_sp.AAC.1